MQSTPRFLICGTVLNGLMHLPYALQLAFGLVKIAFKISLLLTIVFIPTIITLTVKYGVIGAAIAWLALNVIYMIIGVPLTHRRVLKGETKTWFFNLIYIFAITLLVVLAGRYVFINFISPKAFFASILVIFSLAQLSAGMSSKYIRGIIKFKLLGEGPTC